MKSRHGRLFGFAVIAMAAIFTLTGCQTEEESAPPANPGPKPPAASELPALPAGATAVGTVADATTLLTALKDSGIGNSIRNEVEGVIYNNAANQDDYTIADKTGDGVKVISASGLYKAEGDIDFDNPPFTKGQKWKSSYKNNWKAALTADKTSGEATVLKDSVLESKDESSMDITVTAAGDQSTAKISGSASGIVQYAFGLTVTSGGKAAKIVLEAKNSGSTQLSNVLLSETQNQTPAEAYSGSLTVYGADNNAPVYKLSITDAATYGQALGYFGLK